MVVYRSQLILSQVHTLAFNETNTLSTTTSKAWLFDIPGANTTAYLRRWTGGMYEVSWTNQAPNYATIAPVLIGADATAIQGNYSGGLSPGSWQSRLLIPAAFAKTERQATVPELQVAFMWKQPTTTPFGLEVNSTLQLTFQGQPYIPIVR